MSIQIDMVRKTGISETLKKRIVWHSSGSIQRASSGCVNLTFDGLKEAIIQMLGNGRRSIAPAIFRRLFRNLCGL